MTIKPKFFLSRLKNIETPVVILNKYSEGITIVGSELTEIPKRVAVYSWLQGEDLDGKETPDNFQKLGRLAAELHVQTAQKDGIKSFKYWIHNWFWSRSKSPSFTLEPFGKKNRPPLLLG